MSSGCREMHCVKPIEALASLAKVGHTHSPWEPLQIKTGPSPRIKGMHSRPIHIVPGLVGVGWRTAGRVLMCQYSVIEQLLRIPFSRECHHKRSLPLIPVPRVAGLKVCPVSGRRYPEVPRPGRAGLPLVPPCSHSRWCCTGCAAMLLCYYGLQGMTP